jgi:hypothetical protein
MGMMFPSVSEVAKQPHPKEHRESVPIHEMLTTSWRTNLWPLPGTRKLATASAGRVVERVVANRLDRGDPGKHSESRARRRCVRQGAPSNRRHHVIGDQQRGKQSSGDISRRAWFLVACQRLTKRLTDYPVSTRTGYHRRDRNRGLTRTNAHSAAHVGHLSGDF